MIRLALAGLAATLSVLAGGRADWLVALYWMLIVYYWIVQFFTRRR